MRNVLTFLSERGHLLNKIDEIEREADDIDPSFRWTRESCIIHSHECDEAIIVKYSCECSRTCFSTLQEVELADVNFYLAEMIGRPGLVPDDERRARAAKIRWTSQTPQNHAK